MKFKISREEALKQLDVFINSGLENYSFKRNFDLGPNNKSNVSCLSPYISHRLITEYEVAKIVLNKFPYQKIESNRKRTMPHTKTTLSGSFSISPQVGNGSSSSSNNSSCS